MFTGIITDIGKITKLEQQGDLRARIETGYDTSGIDMGASIASDGVCLTVVDLGADWYEVQISAETVDKTNLGAWQVGRRLNLERALKVGDELGGHIVTGHVDGVGHLVSATSEGDSTRLVIAAPSTLAAALAAKGSITLDGISLTVNNVEDQADGSVHFGLNIIPHTAAETTLDALPQGRAFNLEIDVLARYLDRMMSLRTRAM